MAYAGGGFTAYNKTLPGTYVNFISLASAGNAVAQRGTAAVGLKLGWGADNELVSMTSEDFYKNSYRLFGCDAANDSVKAVRDIFKHAHKLICFRLNGGGEKAFCALATAAHSGTAGNNLRIAVEADADNENMFIVTTFFGSYKADEQRVSAVTELKDNGYVVFKRDATLSANAGMTFAGGTNGEESREKHQQFLSLLEECGFDTLGLAKDDIGLKALYTEYTRRMREKGVKFQTVLYSHAADYEGVINVGNRAVGDEPAAAVYWVTGLCAGTEVNETAFNRLYDGEYELEAGFTLDELEQSMQSGVFLLHKTGNELRVLSDINSLVSVSGGTNMSRIFAENQTVRVIDRIANDTASLFIGKYMGKFPNNAAGRAAIWSDIVSLFQALNDMGAIEGFNSEDIAVEAGADKKSVIINQTVEIPGTMEKLYMTCVLE